MKKNKIIVIGAGYAGLRTVEKLAKNQNNEILLLDKNPYHYMQTEVYDLIANEEDFAQITVDLFTFCAGFNDNVTFLKQEVTNIDYANKKVITPIQRYHYDYLVIAVGSRTKFVGSIEGAREFSHGIKALHRAMYFKQKFEMSLFKKVDESGTHCTPLHIVVAGAGLSGVEIAAQMASFSREFYHKNNFLCRKLNIVIINAAESILWGLDSKLVTQSIKRLEQLHVDIKNNVKVTKISKTQVTLSSGEKLPMDFVIFAAGIEPNGLVFNLNVPKNERGFLCVDEYLRLQGKEDVFAIGDCATIEHNGTPIAPTADVAEQMGELCAKNITHLIERKPLVQHTIKSRGILIALGRKYAVAKLFGFYTKGYLAYFMKKVVERLYAKRLDMQSRSGCKKIFQD